MVGTLTTRAILGIDFLMRYNGIVDVGKAQLILGKAAPLELHRGSQQMQESAATFLSVVEDFGQQLDDAILGPVLRAKQQGQKLPASEIKSMSRGSRQLFQIWDQLMVREQTLYRQYDSPGDGEVVQQLVILECKKTEVFKDMHEGILGGHLGEEKILGLIRERFYCPALTMMYATGAKHAWNVQPRNILLLKEELHSKHKGGKPTTAGRSTHSRPFP